MTKKFMSMFLALVMCLTLAAPAFAADGSENMKAAEQAALTYLEECAYSLYFHEERETEAYTIQSLTEDKAVKLQDNSELCTTVYQMRDTAPKLDSALDTGRITAFEDNLTLQEARISYYGKLHELANVTFKYFTPSYTIVDSNISKNIATVNVYEQLDFEYSDCDEPSWVITHYFVTLIKVNNEWLVAAVESDDLFYQEYCETGFDLQKEIAEVEQARDYSAQEQVSMMTENAEPVENTSVRAVTANDREYIAKNAVNYALTYSTSSDESDKIPSYKNDYFNWDDNSCMLFVSQCIWAGFGGSNTEEDVKSKRGMDTNGSYTWWSTGAGCSGSWWSCSSFRTYIENVNESTSESGIVCDTYTVPATSNDMVGTSGLTADDLIGAALHVKGSGGALGHAIFCNNATGTTRDEVYFTAYNKCHKNIKLSTNFPKQTNGQIWVMIPRYLRGGNGNSSEYLYGDLKNALVLTSSGTKQTTLYGRSNESQVTLTLKVYAPDATTPKFSFTAHNAAVVSGSVLLDKAGDWRVEVGSPGLDTFTYIVRVVEP